MYFNEKEADLQSADLVITKGSEGITYVCKLCRANVTPTPGVPIESKPCWQILRITETEDSETGITTTKMQYPNGSKAFSFAPDSADDYIYDYDYSL